MSEVSQKYLVHDRVPAGMAAGTALLVAGGAGRKTVPCRAGWCEGETGPRGTGRGRARGLEREGENG